MAKKKKKSVLDYDPLAWLNESDKDGNNEKSAASEEEKKPKKLVKKAAKKSTKKVVKKAAKKVVKKKAVKKKAVEKIKSKKKTEDKPVDVKSNEDDGFGFFAEEESPSTVENTETEDGFGFFAEPNQAIKEDVAKETSNDDGFGFFTDELNSLTADDNSEETAEDEGFGFFANDKELEEVNTEKLDITKGDAINLGSELTIKTVSGVKNQIEGLLSSDEDIVINAEEMIKIDTAGLQLLYSLKETLSQTGHHIKWIGTSTVINDSAEMIGMSVLAPKNKEACFGFFEENMAPKDAEDGNSGFF